jgi:hypothetical protein
VCFLFSDVHEDYHGPGDDPQKIDVDKVRRVTRLVLRMLDEMQADELDLGPRPSAIDAPRKIPPGEAGEPPK